VISLVPRPLRMAAPPRVKSLRDIEAQKRTGSPYPRCALGLRLGARLADLGLAWGFFLAGGRAGAVLAILYLLLADGMFSGQSIGKRIFGVRVVHLPTRSSGRKRDSTLRNAPLALPVLLGMMPELGPLAFAVGAAVVGAVEGVRVLREPLGLRFGDVWAQTQVVDGREVAGEAGQVADRGPSRAAGRVTSRTMVQRRRSSRCASR
jgi:hypothetical protein